MGTFLISYSLHAPIQDYHGLVGELKRIGTWWYCMESVWIIVSNETCSLLRDRLVPHMAKDDELFIVGIKGNWATHNFSDGCNDWLAKNLE